MADQIPWTGGISNRQIFSDTARGVVIAVAVTFSLFELFWWLSSFIPFANPNWRAPVCAGLAACLASPIARWCRA